MVRRISADFRNIKQSTKEVTMNQKILMTGWGYPPNIDGGLDIHVKHLFEELRSKGVEVDLVLPADRAPEKENVIPVEVGEGDMVQKARRLSQKAAELAKDYDIVHTHDWFGAEAGFKAQKYSDVKWVSTFHSLSSSRNRNPGEELQKLEKVAAEKADQTIAVSNKLKKEVKNEFKSDPNVIHNGFSIPDSSGVKVRKRHGIEGEMILFIGRHAEQKGLEHLIYGFNKLLHEQEATLVIGGNGHLSEALQTFTEILEIEENVVFTGFIPREELGDYYAAADVFVSPSINEPFGLTITEALESGTPVVATSNGVEEIVGGSIFSVEPESDSIKNGVQKALERNEAVEYSNRNWKQMAGETVKVYGRLS